jgi:hypothetical protein
MWRVPGAGPRAAAPCPPPHLPGLIEHQLATDIGVVDHGDAGEPAIDQEGPDHPQSPIPREVVRSKALAPRWGLPLLEMQPADRVENRGASVDAKGSWDLDRAVGTFELGGPPSHFPGEEPCWRPQPFP